ncbi:MAG TPA: dipeptide ABC transporter ATP-binding protein [Anaerolineae bacterium]|nr:dipeptide ABC transporter ATP-binding protein [Anaerolineae bacterium]
MQTSRDLPILKVDGLAISYETRYGDVHAVRDVSFEIKRGEAHSIVGESGCGKSTVAFGIVNFLGRNGKIVAGRILFQGRDLVGRSPEELRKLRGDRIAMVYQDPMQALNPSMRLGDQMAEVLVVHRHMHKRAAEDRCLHMLERVYMADPANVMWRYPHQISGGQQQRVVIAMALLNDPALLIMDEPTTALDVTVEAEVLDLIAELQKDFETAIMYITHNLGVVARVSKRVGVMYAGEMVELATVEEVYLRPHHPYTQGLMRCVPRLGMDKTSSLLYPIRGRVPSPKHLPPGCVFEPRCDYARPQCRQQRPALREVTPDHWARCFFAEEVVGQGQQPPAELATHLAALRAPERAEPILKVGHACTYYEAPSRKLLGGHKQFVKAVDDVSLQVQRGETFGIVGESGCGKTTLVKTIIGMEKPTGGEFEFLGLDIAAPVSQRDLALIRNLQMVFQNPDSTLNPSFSVGAQIARPLRRFKTVPRDQIRAEVMRLLDMMKLGEAYYDRLPRQLSGGEKQRVGIARAIAGRPQLVLCDEPVSALDVSVQAAVLNLLLEIQHRTGTTLVFIAHDLGIVRFFCDQIAVMYLGQIVEIGPAEAIYAPPYHPYTEALLSAVPIPDPRVVQKHVRLSGTVPSALNPPDGCRFHTRCPRKLGPICETEPPPWQQDGPDHRIFCHIPLEELRQVEPVVTMR